MESKVHLRIADPTDSDKLSDFFFQIATQGLIDIKIKRPFDFFSLYNRLQLSSTTFLLEEESKPIPLGTATFLNQKFVLSDSEKNIGYACDLRVSPQRKAIINWTKHFLPELIKYKNQNQIEHFLTALSLDNTQVMNSFIKTRSQSPHKPFYQLLRKFNLASVHGFYPWSLRRSSSHVQIRFSQKADKDQIAYYIFQNLKDRDLVPVDLLKDVKNYIENSFLYSFQRFILALDKDNHIVGLCYPLSSSLLQDYFPQKYNDQAHNFRQFLKFASLFGFARKLTKPFSRTLKDQALNFQYLHFLFFNHPDVLTYLLKFAFKQSEQNEFLVYAYEEENFKYRPPQGSIHAKLKYGLYEMHEPHRDMDQGLKPKLKKNIWFDSFPI